MQLKKLLITLAVSLLSSCALMRPDVPAPPSVELGVIDYPNGQVITNITGAPSFQRIQSTPSYRTVVSAIAEGGSRVPLASYDRAIAFKPSFWTAVQNYINALNRFIANNCGEQ